jgi:GxxExxY protein
VITEIKKQITVIKGKDPLTERIIGCAYKVHRELGPGFNEGIYHNALKVAFDENELKYQTEKSYNVSFQGKRVGRLRLDLVVEDEVVIEVKAITGNVPPVFDRRVPRNPCPSGRGQGVQHKETPCRKAPPFRAESFNYRFCPI